MESVAYAGRGIDLDVKGQQAQKKLRTSSILLKRRKDEEEGVLPGARLNHAVYNHLIKMVLRDPVRKLTV